MYKVVDEIGEKDTVQKTSTQVCYILLPVYNEERNLGKVISDIRMVSGVEEIRIIAIDDGSNDKSLEILQENLTGTDSLRSYKINMNIGAVFSEGINTFISRAQKGDVLIIMESDGTSDVKKLQIMADSLRSGNNDVVIASRYRSTGGYIGFPPVRKILSVGANKLMRWRFPIGNIKDYTIFYRAYSFEILEKLVAWYGHHGFIRRQGFPANTELLVKASFLGAKIEEIPFEYDYGKKEGRSKLRIVSTLIEYFTMWGELSTVSEKLGKHRKSVVA